MLAPVAMFNMPLVVASPAPVVAGLGFKRVYPRMETLLDTLSARVTLRQQTANATARFTIEAVNGSLPIDDATVEGVFDATEEVLGAGAEFKTLWNLQNCPVPSSRIVLRSLRWAMAHKRDLDRLNVCMAVVLPTKRPVILSVVNNVLRAFGPRCPVRATADLQDAIEFLDQTPHADPSPTPPTES